MPRDFLLLQQVALRVGPGSQPGDTGEGREGEDIIVVLLIEHGRGWGVQSERQR